MESLSGEIFRKSGECPRSSEVVVFVGTWELVLLSLFLLAEPERLMVPVDNPWTSGFQWRNPSKWLVYNEKFYENPMKMDDLGVPNFGKAPYEKSTPQPRDLFFSVAQGAGRLHCWFLRFYPPGVNHGWKSLYVIGKSTLETDIHDINDMNRKNITGGACRQPGWLGLCRISQSAANINVKLLRARLFSEIGMFKKMSQQKTRKTTTSKTNPSIWKNVGWLFVGF